MGDHLGVVLSMLITVSAKSLTPNFDGICSLKVDSQGCVSTNLACCIKRHTMTLKINYIQC